jgi:2-phosphosulfolactate phosphatase
MKRILNVYALPTLVAAGNLAGDTAVVIDVLRASTTIVYALAAGAKEVIPCLEVPDAVAVAKRFRESSEPYVIGGERGGSPIEGFDLGNSPDEYTSDQVGGKSVVFTTTNGTRAMLSVRSAKEILIAAFVNASAVARELIGKDRIHILCAGTDGHISDDDVLLAGMLVERLERASGNAYQQNAQAATAREFWLHSFTLPKGLGAESLDPETLNDRLRTSRGAQNLLTLGFGEDIRAAAQIDRFDCVPRFYPSAGRIRV